MTRRSRARDEALYWLAHSQNQAGDPASAVATISRLERDYPTSMWVKTGAVAAGRDRGAAASGATCSGGRRWRRTRRSLVTVPPRARRGLRRRVPEPAARAESPARTTDHDVQPEVPRGAEGVDTNRAAGTASAAAAHLDGRLRSTPDAELRDSRARRTDAASTTWTGSCRCSGKSRSRARTGPGGPRGIRAGAVALAESPRRRRPRREDGEPSQCRSRRFAISGASAARRSRKSCCRSTRPRRCR